MILSTVFLVSFVAPLFPTAQIYDGMFFLGNRLSIGQKKALLIFIGGHPRDPRGGYLNLEHFS